MDPIENRLIHLKSGLRGPSPGIDRRMAELFAQAEPAQRIQRPDRPRRVMPAWWAAAAALAVGLLGFAAGLGLGRRSGGPAPGDTIQAGHPLPPAVTVRLVVDQPARNPFDMTRNADDGLPSNPTVTITQHGV